MVTPLAPHLERILSRLKGVKPRGRGWRALCPAHPDLTPSLDVDQGDDRRILFICRSHRCTAKEIVTAIGLTQSDLFPDHGRRNGHTPPPPRKKSTTDPPMTLEQALAACSRTGRVEGHWTFADADGVPVLLTVRIKPADSPKTYRQLHAIGDLWAWGGAGRALPLLRVHELRAASADEPVLVFEGELKADLAASFGWTATTSAGGSSAPHKSDWSALAGRRVVVFPDADDAGATYANTVVKLARAARAVSVRVLRLPGLQAGSGEDLVDWVAKKESGGLERDEIAHELALLIEATTGDEQSNGEGDTQQEQAAEQLFAGVRLLDAEEVAKLPPIEWLIENVLPEKAIAVWAGDTMVGKSFLALDAALRLQHGMSFFGHQVEAGSTIYFAGEGQSGLAARMNLWRQQHEGEPGDHYCLVSEEIPVLGADTMAKLFAVIEAVAKAKGHAPSLIVIDTLSQGLADDENESKVVAPVMRALAAVRNRFGCTILIVHHLVKLNTKGAKADVVPTLDMVRGSGVVTRNADTVLVAWKGKDGQRFWKVLKQKDGEELGAIGFQLLVMATGRHRRRGQIETSCIVVPAEQGAQPAQLDTDALLRQKEGEDIDRLVAAIRREGSFGSRDGLVMAAGINLQRGRAMLDLALQRGAIVDLGKPKRPKLVLPGTARTQQDQGGRESPHTPRDGRTDSVPSRPSRPRPPETDRTDWTDSPTGGGQ